MPYGQATDLMRDAAKKNSDAFVAFLDILAAQAPNDKPVFLVLDNASYHRSAVATAGFAAVEARLKPLFLPPYCSMLNPIERYWRHLKDSACANKLFPSMERLIASVLVNLKQQNDCSHPKRFSICKDLQTSTYFAAAPNQRAITS